MSTNCMIAKELYNISGDIEGYEAIYCHYDGYIEGVGATLNTYYNEERLIDKLMRLGDMSSLEQRLEPSEDEVHSFENPIRDVTIFYGRDRGERDCGSVIYKNLIDLVVNSKYSTIEYIYIFKEDEGWKVIGYEDMYKIITSYNLLLNTTKLCLNKVADILEKLKIGG